MKEELIKELDEKVKKAIRFIDEVLLPRNDTTKTLLVEFEHVLLNYQKDHNIGSLRKMREIDSRPSPEGGETDYTAGMSLPLDGTYNSLDELILGIEDLVFEIERN